MLLDITSLGCLFVTILRGVQTFFETNRFRERSLTGTNLVKRSQPAFEAGYILLPAHQIFALYIIERVDIDIVV